MARSTYGHLKQLQYRVRAASALLGLADTTLRTYADASGLDIRRGSDLKPGSPAVRVFSPENLFELSQWRRSSGNVRIPSFEQGPVVIAVSVIKGGTGKTTTAVETAIHLQLKGLRVLVIDLDVQANASQLMGYEPDLTIDEAAEYDLTAEAIVTETFANVLGPYLESRRSNVAPSSRIQASGDLIKMPFGVSGPHLIAADTYLSDIEQLLANAKGTRELYIRNLLTAAKEGNIPGLDLNQYDVVIFDTPPAVSYTSTAALAAADFVVAPIKLDAFSVKGLTKLTQEIEALNESYKVRPELIILPTHYQPQLARIGRMQKQIDLYRDLIAPNVINASEKFPRSLDAYLPLSLQEPTSTATKEYQMFAEFIYGKIIAKASSHATTRKVAA